tara:strand:- start:72 stop:521 length:450 start_codon:yes stop_codon:yes gene_type:complete
MATRNINTFIEHLMNEQMTAAGTAGGGDTKAGKGAGETSTRSGGDGGDYYHDPSRRKKIAPGAPGTIRPRRIFPRGISPGHPDYDDPGEGGQFPEDPYPGRGRTPVRLPGSRPFGPEDAVGPADIPKPRFPFLSPLNPLNIPGYFVKNK